MSDIFYATIYFPPAKRGDSVIESAELMVERYTRTCLKITDKNAEDLTPNSLHIEKDSYIKVWERDDGVFEYLDTYTQAPYKEPQLRKGNPIFGGCFIQFMIIFAAIVFCLSAIVHFSTYIATGLFISKMDNVGLLHILIFPPFIAAVLLAQKWGATSKNDDGQDRIDRHAPKWMKLICGACFGYALINFVLCMIFTSGGRPGINKEDKYVMESHGRTLKLISKQEYDHAQAIVTRAFSGHWLLFSSAAVMMLTGVAEIRRRRLAGEPLEPKKTKKADVPTEPETISTGKSVVARAMRGELDLKKETSRCDAALREETKPPRKELKPHEKMKICAATQESIFYDPTKYDEPFVSRKQAVYAIITYIISVLAILANNPITTAILTPLFIYVGIKSLRRLFERSKRKNEQFRSICGCFSVIPNFFLAGVFAESLGKLVCVAIYADFTQALMGTVKFAARQSGPYVLTNGATIDSTVYGVVSFATFPLTVIFLAALTGLMEYAGRSLKL